MKTEANKSLFLKCECSEHVFECEHIIEEWGDSQKEEFFYLTFWSYGCLGQILNWKERWRWIWNILKTGKPWADGIIIKKTKAKELIEYINNHLPKE